MYEMVGEKKKLLKILVFIGISLIGELPAKTRISKSNYGNLRR